jgi:hypothetical protein
VPDEIKSFSKKVRFKSFATDDMICLSGPVSEEMKEAFERHLKPTTRFLVVRSNGGRADYGMDIAEEILKRGMDIIVHDFCLSACANYFFLAAHNKFLINNAIVGWHGAPEPIPEERWLRFSDKARQRHNEDLGHSEQLFAIFRERGIRKEVTNQPPPGFLSPEKGDPHNRIWSYRDDLLEERYGIRNLFRLDIDSATGEWSYGKKTYQERFGGSRSSSGSSIAK